MSSRGDELPDNVNYMTKRIMYLTLSQIHQGSDISIFCIIYKGTTAEVWDILEKKYRDVYQV